MRQDEWPEEPFKTLIALAKDGYSAREIVERLWLIGFKTTRNAVLGKAHRNNIDVGSTCAGFLSSKRYGRKKLIEMGANDLPPKEPIPDHGLCQWATGHTWCGCPVLRGVYCQEHRMRAYTGEIALTIDEIKRLV